jgi:predicted transcriptional regulator
MNEFEGMDLGEDTSMWEACMMAKIKSNDFAVYNQFAKRSAAMDKLKLERYSDRLKVMTLQIITIVNNTGLSQTKVRHALKRLIRMGLVVCTKHNKPMQYTTRVEQHRAKLAMMQYRSNQHMDTFGSVEEMRATLTDRLSTVEKTIRAMKRRIKTAKDEHELAEFDREWRL